MAKPEGKSATYAESPPLITTFSDCTSTGAYTTTEHDASIHVSCRISILLSFALTALARRRETQFPCPCPLAICTISCIGPPLDKMSHSLLSRSSRRKSNTLCRDTGIQTEVAALSTIPGGSPGSSTFFLVITFMSSPRVPM
ncbi:hypothetical protein V8G54_030096 [Vigna mungo]|uniref:Uncharacterized protein n=1 Tax=Vigna mungo TaxID=3915 RepID=A0AAQ3RNA5_VIGMU